MAWLLADPDRAQQFIVATGATPGDLAALAQDTNFLGSVLDFLLTEDALVTGFCDAAGLPYTAPMQARPHLPGFSQMHWT